MVGHLSRDLVSVWVEDVASESGGRPWLLFLGFTPVGLSSKMIMSLVSVAVGVSFAVGGLSLGKEAQVGASLVVGKRLVGEVVGGGRGSGGRSWLSWLEALGNQVVRLLVQGST